jgi:hypothetical protein
MVDQEKLRAAVGACILAVFKVHEEKHFRMLYLGWL